MLLVKNLPAVPPGILVVVEGFVYEQESERSLPHGTSPEDPLFDSSQQVAPVVVHQLVEGVDCAVIIVGVKKAVIAVRESSSTIKLFFIILLKISSCAPREIRTPNICFEGKDDIHFNMGARHWWAGSYCHRGKLH